MSGRGRDLAVVQRCGRLEQPIERLAQLTLGPRPRCARSRRTSSIAHANTYRSSRRASTSVRATTRSVSLIANSRARWRATQSHCRQAWRQNSRRRPVFADGGSTRRHHRQRAKPSPPVPSRSLFPFVMTKQYPYQWVPGFDRLSGRSVGSQRSRQTPPGRAARWQCHVARRKRRRPARSGVRECRRDYRTVRRRRH